jgi:large subunit ribosomal protein L25
MDHQIAVEPREATGKQTKRLRAAGIVPGVVFGKKAGSVAVQLDAKVLDTLYRAAGRTSLVALTINGGASTSVVIKSIQRNPLTGRILHVDFFAPDLTHEMTADIPISFSGTAPGVEASGGYLLTSLDHLKVRALPSDFPHEISVDVSSLVDLDTAILVRDLAVGGKVTVLNEPDELVAKVMPPRVEVEPEPEISELEEGEEGAEAAAEGEGEGEAGEAGEGSAEGSSEGAE